MKHGCNKGQSRHQRNENKRGNQNPENVYRTDISWAQLMTMREREETQIMIIVCSWHMINQNRCMDIIRKLLWTYAR